MFRKNQKHLQIPLTSHINDLPEKLRKRLDSSWAGMFYQQVFLRINEAAFKELYATDPSRPNIPVNVLVALEFLKAGNGWSDEELYDNFCYDLQVRYAIGYHQLGEGDFELRTLYNFRSRISDFMQDKGRNLIKECFEQVTDAQIKAFQVKTGKQRMDSVQVSSNIRSYGRLQLLVEVMQRVERMLNDADKARYAETFAPYLKGHAGHYVYRLKGEDLNPHTQKIGELMEQLLVELKPGYGAEPIYQVLMRVFGEHFRFAEAKVSLKPNTELSSSSLQSPDDLEATYREKRGQGYQGYVANLTETCDPENALQLITAVQLESNNTDDDQLLKDVLPELAQRTDVQTIYTDGGYGGKQSGPSLTEHQIELIQSAIRGRNPDASKPHLAEFGIQFGANHLPEKIVCQNGQTVPVKIDPTKKSYKASFDADICADCPFFKDKCLAKTGKQTDKQPGFRFTLDQARSARRRRKSEENKREKGNLRAAVEATVRSVKLPFPGAQLPVRGKFRVLSMLIGSAIVANMRRIQRYLLGLTQPKVEAVAV
jgi:hypothetical protein